MRGRSVGLSPPGTVSGPVPAVCAFRVSLQSVPEENAVQYSTVVLVGGRDALPGRGGQGLREEDALSMGFLVGFSSTSEILF
jgi:hypothetical protein